MTSLLRYDVAIVGSGFAGTILARALVRQGARVLLVERDHHPRFALGESSTPLAGLSLERLAARFDLPDLRDLATYGRWSRRLPHLRRGLKRGFTFFHHRPGVARVTGDPMSSLLVAASPNDAIADSHWLRADVDTHLVARARDEGVDYRDHITLDEVVFDDAGVLLRGTRWERRVQFRAAFIVDGSGPRGFLARTLPIADHTTSMGVRSRLLFAHVEGVPTVAEAEGNDHGCDPSGDPYPADRAAIHHLLGDHGWAYALPFDHGVTSVGVVLRDRLGYRSKAGRDPFALARAALAPFPAAAHLLAGRPRTPWCHVPRIQHRLARAAGNRWFLLPHAFAFVDPMFSTGMAWSLLAVERLAAMLTGDRVEPDRYDSLLQREADQIEQLIAASYATQNDFGRFVAVSKVYFATVSFAETQQRLEPARDDAWYGFLGANAPSKQSLFREVLARAEAGSADLAPWIDEQIASFDVIGLNTMRDNRLPASLDVLVDRADRLGLSREAVIAALPRLRGEFGPMVESFSEK